jgi:AGCS family alanine or glycine:cation symporter
LAGAAPPAHITVAVGRRVSAPGEGQFAWHDAPVERFFTDEAQSLPFTGVIDTTRHLAVAGGGSQSAVLYGDAVETGAPLTTLAFERGFSSIDAIAGDYIVILGVLLFAISTAISWSYYGDRCANYLFGPAAIRPYRTVYVVMHFVGAVAPLAALWDLGDVFLGIVILPNLIALILLSPKVVELTRSYFERKPWIENAAVRKAARGRRPQP